MYSKFYLDRKGVKQLKLGMKKVSGEEGEDSFRSIFQTVIKSDQKYSVFYLYTNFGNE